ncbi:hypothetical protein ACFP1Z_00130 [Streptomyces gamaensis]|uniref:Uncharacterized protein n=1 Tax=Streptomyces gamaensis TaxID=1763542 RepID=A0ABW0YPU5_9ACTN
METQAMEAMEQARRWLSDQGVVEAGEGWVEADRPDWPLTANDVAHSWVDKVFREESLTPTEQLWLAFGLLDLLDDYWVTCVIGSAYGDADRPLPSDVLWDGYRRRLEAQRDAEPVTYSLWVDWFEDRDTAAMAFAEVLGNDIERVVTERSDALLRRADRVLDNSGPVPWSIKQGTYEIAARLPALHGSLFQGLLGSYHDVYGDLEPKPALALLMQLDLPEDTPHLAQLRSVLAAGHENHYRSPDAWDDAAASNA